MVVIRPLFVVTGASGSGKTTIFPDLLSRMAGWCAVFDVDWLIDPLGHAAKDGQVDWPSFRDTWLYIAHGVAQNGLPTLLLAPFIPQHLDGLPGREWVGEIHYLVLDCPDDERVRRIEARPRWRGLDVDAQTEFGRWLSEEPGTGHRHQHTLAVGSGGGSGRLGPRAGVGGGETRSRAIGRLVG